MKINVNGITRDMTEEEIKSTTLEMPTDFKISELKQKLADTDYVACKIAEGVATREEYADILAEREVWRKEINALEQETEAIL